MESIRTNCLFVVGMSLLALSSETARAQLGDVDCDLSD